MITFLSKHVQKTISVSYNVNWLKIFLPQNQYFNLEFLGLIKTAKYFAQKSDDI